MTGRVIPSAVALCAIAAFLAGCGKAGKPERPEDAIYPMTYPSARLGPGNGGKALTSTQPTGRVFIDPSIRSSQLLSPGSVNAGAGQTESTESEEGESDIFSSPGSLRTTSSGRIR